MTQATFDKATLNEEQRGEYDDAFEEGRTAWFEGYFLRGLRSEPGTIAKAGWDAGMKAARLGEQPAQEQDDTPSLANCDDAGTGEGAYHGRI